MTPSGPCCGIPGSAQHWQSSAYHTTIAPHHSIFRATLLILLGHLQRMQKSVAAGVPAQITVQLERMEADEMNLTDAMNKLDPNVVKESRRLEQLSNQLNSLSMHKMELESQLQSVSTASSKELRFTN